MSSLRRLFDVCAASLSELTEFFAELTELSFETELSKLYSAGFLHDR